MLRWETIAIEPDWIDYNGHLNMAAYLVIFDRAIDRLIDHVGLASEPGDAPTLFAASAKIDYLRELPATATPDCTTTVVRVDDKRVHSWQELVVGGAVHARCENLHLHVDRRGSAKVAPFSPDVRKRLEELAAAPPPWLAAPVAGRMG